jgi:hypothetical protein
VVKLALATATTISLVTFFLGPFFAKQTILRKVQGNRLRFFFVVVQLGAAVYPTVAGVMIVARKGVEVLQL